jgi:hypothetical protein
VSQLSRKRPSLSITTTRSLISAPLAAPSASVIISLAPLLSLLTALKSLTSPTDLSALD